MIKAVVLIHWTLIALIAIFVVTQILVPAIRSRPLLPLLRKRNRETEARLAEARGEADLRRIENETAALTPTPPRRQRSPKQGA